MDDAERRDAEERRKVPYGRRETDSPFTVLDCARIQAIAVDKVGAELKIMDKRMGDIENSQKELAFRIEDPLSGLISGMTKLTGVIENLAVKVDDIGMKQTSYEAVRLSDEKREDKISRVSIPVIVGCIMLVLGFLLNNILNHVFTK